MPRLTETLKADLDYAEEHFNLRRVDPIRLIDVRAQIATLEALQQVAAALESILARLPLHTEPAPGLPAEPAISLASKRPKKM
ncbi:MAG: hypothetical protein AB1894_15715 [Chloroflexota bacterium]